MTGGVATQLASITTVAADSASDLIGCLAILDILLVVMMKT